MKKVLSLLLSFVMLFTLSLSFGFEAQAKTSQLDIQRKQFNSQNAHYNYSGKTFVKTKHNYDTNYTTVMLSSSLNKKGKKFKVYGGVENLALNGKYIYYYNSDSWELIRAKKNGKGKKTIAKSTGYCEYANIPFIIDGKHIAYNIIERDSLGYYSSLYACKLNGKGKKKIASGVISDFYTYKGNLYYIKGSKLYKYSFKKKKAKALKVKMNFKNKAIVGMENNKLYVFKELDSYGNYKEPYHANLAVYVVDVNKKNVKLVTKAYNQETEFIHEVFIYKGRVYFSIGTGGGNGVNRVNNGKYDKDYEVGDLAGGEDGIGYYNGKPIFKICNFKNGNISYKNANL